MSAAHCNNSASWLNTNSDEISKNVIIDRSHTVPVITDVAVMFIFINNFYVQTCMQRLQKHT